MHDLDTRPVRIRTPVAGQSGSVDPNFIPQKLVSRMEIVSGHRLLGRVLREDS
jgi:hypothetical protein